MAYALLHAHCQQQEVHVPRNLVRDKVLELTGLNRVSCIRTTLDTAVCRGFFLSGTNVNHPLVAQFGGSVIAVARGLNRCWERFVYVKELMHIFDDDNAATDSGEKFEGMLEELMMPSSPAWSPQMESELRCFWRAMGVLCPEASRAEFADKRRKGQIDDYGVALALRIPQQYVRYLFEPTYQERLARAIG